MLTGELKAILIEKINKFLVIHQEKREKAKETSKKLKRRNNITKKEDIIKEIKIEIHCFYMGIDLRVYGPNPKQPIYHNDIPYYFNEEQIKLIKK